MPILPQPARPPRLGAALLPAAFAALAILTAALTPSSAEAFCGFYVGGADAKLFNDATQVVLMREDNLTVQSMQNSYQGPASDFAMVVPVPVVLREGDVKVISNEVFKKVDQLAAPRLVEYWERDPCYRPPPRRYYEKRSMAMPTSAPDRMVEEVTKKDLGVKIEAQFEVGEYEVVILSAKESNGLETWLKLSKYNIPDGAAAALKPYIQQGMYFFVAKVNIKKVTLDAQGRANLSPLRFHYRSDEFSLPIRLGMLNAKGAQDLIIHILARGRRFEVANAKNVAIPTNLVVSDGMRSQFGPFYVSLFDYTLKENPGAVVTEYSWDASTCDPCPGPTLNNTDFMTLGMDAVYGVDLSGGPARMQRRPAGGWVLTRLHARYTPKDIKDDLTFRAAPPIAGGRGTPQGAQGTMREEGVKPNSRNNFQGRYIILHHWDGPIACASPQRGVWGGRNKPTPAMNTATIPRGQVQLASAVVGTTIPTTQLLPQGPHKVTTPAPLRPGTGPSATGRMCASPSPHGLPAPAPLLVLVFGAIGVAVRAGMRR